VNRFNLTFSGEILAGEDIEQARLRFADKFGIDDQARLAKFFSGETIILRRNLERKEAAELYYQLQLMGLASTLVKVATADTADETIDTAPPKTPVKDKASARDTGRKAVTAQTSSQWLPNDADAAAQIKARKLEAKRLAAETAARETAALQARQRQLAEEKARVAAELAEQQRLAEQERARQAAEEAAQKAAEAAERKRHEEAEAARKKALRAAAKRKAAEEAAQRKARRLQEKAAKARKKAEEAARRKAELEEQKRLAAEEDARLKAELEEKKRLAAEEDARLKAALEEKKRLKAEEDARLKAVLEEKQRLAAEEARHRAELEERKRLAAEEDARLKAALEERKRLAAEEEVRRIQAEEQKQHLAAGKAARARAERVQQQQLSKRSAERPTSAAAAQPRTGKTLKTRVKTSLEVPLRTPGETPEIGNPGQRKRQSGAPNFYKIRPFRNSEQVRTRAELAWQRMRRAYTAGGVALAILLIAGGGFLQSGAHPVPTGASAVGINARAEPVLLAADSLLLHDRSGVATTDIPLSALGVTALLPPLLFDSEDSLIAVGQLIDNQSSVTQRTGLSLLRCDLTRFACAPLSSQLQETRVDAVVVNTLDDSLLLADSASGRLLKVSKQGEILASAPVTVPNDPVLRLHGGLLWMNSAQGPAISVFRYENDAFGSQLDEILLLPPGNEQLQQSRVRDFVWSGGAWWVYLQDPASVTGEVYRFDEEWNYLSTAPLASGGTGPLQLVNWGTRTLVNDPHDPAIQRFNAEGLVEVPFLSTSLQELIGTQQHRAHIANIAWHGGLLVLALAVILCFGAGYVHGLRGLVYRPRREQGAEPLDDHADALHWIEPVQDRQQQLQRTGVFYGVAALGAVLLAIALGVSAWQLAALLLALSGPAIALLLLSRQPVGHIGIMGDRLLLVDHSGQYHLAGGPRLHYRGPFLSIDDIVVFSGSHLLPAFSPAPLQRYISPPTLGAIRVDHKTIAIKLLQSRHPLALGATAIAAAIAAAALLLLLQQLF
tara:strand:- start:2466 stop:5495 length:3030 start_codon:yes stop_codon:yes gene_type:complete